VPEGDGAEAERVVAGTPAAIAGAFRELAEAQVTAARARSPGHAGGALPLTVAAICTPVPAADLAGSLFMIDPASPYSGRMRLEIEQGDRERLVWLSRQPPFAVLPASEEGSAELVAGVPGLRQIIGLSGRVERFCGPRELEWVITREGRLLVTWVRRLAAVRAPAILPAALAEARRRQKVLLQGSGEPICPGVAYGRVFVAADETALADCPDHAVVVLRRLELGSGLLHALRRAAALVSEEGRGIDRAAALVRAFRVPALVGARGALSSLPDGDLVTVDVAEGVVYSGFFADLFHHFLLQAPTAAADPQFRLLNQAVRELGSPLAVVESSAAARRESLFSTMQEIFDDTLRRLAAAATAMAAKRGSSRPGLPPGLKVFGIPWGSPSEEPPGGSTPQGSPATAFFAGMAEAMAGTLSWPTQTAGVVFVTQEDMLGIATAGDRMVAVDARISLRRSGGHLMFWCDVVSPHEADGGPLRRIRRKAAALGLDSVRFARSLVAWRDPLPAGSNRDRLVGVGELAGQVLAGRETAES